MDIDDLRYNRDHLKATNCEDSIVCVCTVAGQSWEMFNLMQMSLQDGSIYVWHLKCYVINVSI